MEDFKVHILSNVIILHFKVISLKDANYALCYLMRLLKVFELCHYFAAILPNVLDKCSLSTCIISRLSCRIFTFYLTLFMYL